ncbi:group II truncated hemoglobin [Zobellella sp. DQSA1]|uniref:group II truncated hemoglobin n=1 Tax=Zobellella sp. DQSA1 TaxID=3342386 RepID=UPI0035C0800D
MLWPSAYGQGDSSFRAAGGEAGLRRLAEAFYAAMVRRPDAAIILAMHPTDLAESTDKLARFLCGWLGGPPRYREKYGPISIPRAHTHLAIGPAERDAWLACMAEALERQDYAEDFKQYLLHALRVPAERCRTRD